MAKYDPSGAFSNQCESVQTLFVGGQKSTNAALCGRKCDFIASSTTLIFQISIIPGCTFRSLFDLLSYFFLTFLFCGRCEYVQFWFARKIQNTYDPLFHDLFTAK